jgi:hypothetical protein
VKAESINEFKLSTIENNIFVVYKEVDSIMKLVRDGFKMINRSISALSDDNNGNFGQTNISYIKIRKR